MSREKSVTSSRKKKKRELDLIQLLSYIMRLHIHSNHCHLLEIVPPDCILDGKLIPKKMRARSGMQSVCGRDLIVHLASAGLSK